MKNFKFFIISSLIILTLFSSSLVYAKSMPYKIAKPYPSCDMNYTDITQSIIQRINLVNPLSGEIYDSPIEISQRFYSIYLRNSTTFQLHHYIYDVGQDDLWNTTDDVAHYIPPTYINEISSIESIIEYNGLHSYYRVSTNSIGKLDVTKCDLTLQGCSNSNIQTITSIQEVILGMLPSITQNRLYLALENPNLIFSGDVYSCSLQNNASDSCLLPISNFVNHTSFSLFQNTLKNDGFIFEQNQNSSFNFFSIENQSIFPLPQSDYESNMVVPIIPNMLISHLPARPNFQNASITIIDLLSGTFTNLYYLPSNVGLRTIDFFTRGIGVVYVRYNPYRQFIKVHQNREVEIYRGNSSTAPMPLTLQADYSVISKKYIYGSGVHIYRSNCKG